MEERNLTIVQQAAEVPAMSLNMEDIKKYIAPNATDKELFMFVNIAKAYNLNPMKREIYFIKYNNAEATIVVGYESYIKRAERTGLLDGWSVRLGKDDLGEYAEIEIHRKDRSKPFVWTVYKSEADQGQALWKKMPLFMLRKVAIAQGFRLAFPEEVGGMPYAPEEISGQRSEDLPRDYIEVTPDEPPAIPDEEVYRATKDHIATLDTEESLESYWRKNVKAYKNTSIYDDFVGLFLGRKGEILEAKAKQSEVIDVEPQQVAEA